jgi:hypothetical protein
MHPAFKWIPIGIVLTGLLVFFSCMEEEDMRKQAVNDLGEPDEIQTGGFGVDRYEIYFYDRKDLNRVYIYQKSAPGCGSQGNWYVVDVVYPADIYYDRETYEPPKIVHSPVKTASPGSPIAISAKVTDDQYVKDVILYCRTRGETDFLPVTMAPGDSSMYSGEIPAERATVAGVEYYIEATDSAHKSRLPQVKGVYLITVSPGAEITYGKPQSAPTFAKPVSIPTVGKRSPVAP